MYELYYDYVKPKSGQSTNLCYMDSDSFIVHVKTIFTKVLQKMLKQHLTLQILYQIDHCLKQKNKNKIGPIKDELGRKIIKEFIGLRAKTYNYLKHINDEDKKSKQQGKVCHKKP